MTPPAHPCVHTHMVHGVAWRGVAWRGVAWHLRQLSANFSRADIGHTGMWHGTAGNRWGKDGSMPKREANDICLPHNNPHSQMLLHTAPIPICNEFTCSLAHECMCAHVSVCTHAHTGSGSPSHWHRSRRRHCRRRMPQHRHRSRRSLGINAWTPLHASHVGMQMRTHVCMCARTHTSHAGLQALIPCQSF